MAARTAWVLNLDADFELAVGRGYTPRKGMRETMRPLIEGLAKALLDEVDVLVDESTPAGSLSGSVGRAFCPTPRAIAMLERAGAIPEPYPSFAVLQHVNARSFAASLGPTLPGATFVTTMEEARSKLATAPPLGSSWRVKRPFGMIGRGQRVIPPAGSSEAIAGGDVDFVRGALSEGGAQIEPDVAIVDEYAMHGMIDGAGSVTFGEVVRQICDSRGMWLRSERIETPTVRERSIAVDLAREAATVAAALAREGYFGPFGIDAFTYRASESEECLQTRSEINARYSMGFAVGFTRRRLREPA